MDAKELTYDTIVVGGGIAGLTAAAYQARAGKKVLLIEKNERCGGLVSTFERNGFFFESGARALDSAGITLPMLKDLGIDLEVVRNKVSVGIDQKIISIENADSLLEYQQLLLYYYPKQQKGIEQLILIMKEIMAQMAKLYKMENPQFSHHHKDFKYFIHKLLPWLPQFRNDIAQNDSLNQPIESFLAQIITDQSLIDVISQHFIKGIPSFYALNYFSLYLDYFYPIGGVGVISDKLATYITQKKGQIKLNTQIMSHRVKLKTVCDQHQQAYHYRKLIWAADAKTLYKHTFTPYHLSQKRFLEYMKKEEETLEAHASQSVFSLYLSVNLPPSYFGKIAQGHFFYTPSSQGIGEVCSKELDLLLNRETITDEQLQEWVVKYAQLNTYEIAIPALKDPKLAPEGKTGIMISLVAHYRLFERLNHENRDQAFCETLASQIIAVITQKVYPELKAHIEDQFTSTPLTIASHVNSTEGSIYGWSFAQTPPSIHEMQKTEKSVLTPFPDVYQAGQWAYSPAGVPMAILTGKLASNRTL